MSKIRQPKYVRRVSQNEFVLNHLITHGYITDAVAQTYRIRRLAARIYDLRSEGHKIEVTPCVDDMGQRYFMYHLAA